MCVDYQSILLEYLIKVLERLADAKEGNHHERQYALHIYARKIHHRHNLYRKAGAEKNLKHKRKLYIMFVDLEKTYD